MTEARFDVVVVGTGPVGLSLAAALGLAGLDVALVGSTPAGSRKEPWAGRVYALAPRSRAFLDAMGVWADIDVRSVQPCVAMEVHGDRGGAIRFAAYDVAVPALAYLVSESALEQALWARCRGGAGVRLHAAGFTALENLEAGVAVSLENGERLRCQLLVGADGADSRVRQAAGFHVSKAPYDQHALVGAFECERAHGGAAFQWFRHPDVLAYLPLPDRKISVVWSMPSARARALLDVPSGELADQVQLAGNGRLGSLTAVARQRAFGLSRLRVRQPACARVALVGDAAHVVHPLAGLGVNLGFQDAEVLAKSIGIRDVFRDCGDARILDLYVRSRAEDILAAGMVTHGLQALFSAHGPAVARIRNSGLNAVDRLSVLKSALTRRALG